MGHIFTNQGENVKAVHEMLRPEDVGGIPQLEGFVNYLAKFV